MLAYNCCCWAACSAATCARVRFLTGCTTGLAESSMTMISLRSPLGSYVCSVVHPLPFAPLRALAPAIADAVAALAVDVSAFLRGGMVSSCGGECEYLNVRGGGMRNGEGAR